MPQRGKLPLCGRSQLHRRTRRAGDDQMVWLFDLDNTLHDSSRAIFKAIDRSMTTAVASTLNIDLDAASRSEEHTSELQSLMRISYAVFCLKKKKKKITTITQ